MTVLVKQDYNPKVFNKYHMIYILRNYYLNMKDKFQLYHLHVHKIK